MRVLIFVFIMMCSSVGWAQSNTSPHWTFTPTMGPFLPRGIPRVTEILPFSGFRISKGVGSFRPELGLFHGRSEGVIYYLGSIDFQNSFDLLDLDDIKAFSLVGFQVSYYKPASVLSTSGGSFSASRSFPFIRTFGPHFGMGVKTKITNDMWFKFDFILGFNPGKFTLVGLGLEFKFDSKKQEEAP